MSTVLLSALNVGGPMVFVGDVSGTAINPARTFGPAGSAPPGVRLAPNGERVDRIANAEAETVG